MLPKPRLRLYGLSPKFDDQLQCYFYMQNKLRLFGDCSGLQVTLADAYVDLRRSGETLISPRAVYIGDHIDEIDEDFTATVIEIEGQ